MINYLRLKEVNSRNEILTASSKQMNEQSPCCYHLTCSEIQKLLADTVMAKKITILIFFKKIHTVYHIVFYPACNFLIYHSL